MNQLEFTSELSSELGLTYELTEKIVQAFKKKIRSKLLENESVKLVGLGTFCIKVHKKRKGHDPRTLEQIHIPKTKKVKFKCGNWQDKLK